MENLENTAFNTPEIQRIRGRIQDLIKDHFAKGYDKYYISKLGMDLGNDRNVLEKTTQVKLVSFLGDADIASFSESDDKYKLDREGIHENIIYIERPKNLEKLEVISPVHIPWYNKRLWSAFTIPLNDNKLRYINLNTLLFGPNEADLEADNSDIRPINPEFIAAEGDADKPSDTAARIDRWLDKQGLDKAQFISKRRQPEKIGEESLLDQILNTLDADQIKRCSLPLDVVRTLKERRVR